jgi:hypothetical protein
MSLPTNRGKFGQRTAFQAGAPETLPPSPQLSATPPGSLPLSSDLKITAAAAIIGLALFCFEHIEIQKSVASIPAYSELSSVEGVLQKNVLLEHSYGSIRGGSRASQVFGVIKSADGTATGFSCDPQVDNLDCIYTRPWNNSPLIGNGATVKYATIGGSDFWAYDARAEAGGAPIHIPQQPRAVVMEATVDSGSGPI